MKKLIVSFLTVIMTSIAVSAAGYRGFATIGFGGDFSSEDPFGTQLLNFNTAHGVQLNKYFFIGAGINVLYPTEGFDFNDPSFSHGEVYSDQGSAIISTFVDLRCDLDITRKWTPYIDCKVGYNVKNAKFDDYGTSADASALFINPSVGVRLKLSPKCALNMGLSYSPFKYKITQEIYRNYTEPTGEIITFNHTLQNVLINFGVEF